MRLYHLVITAHFLLQTPSAWAGAWIRPEGQGFVSASATFRWSQETIAEEYGFYGDYGLSERLTLGVDLNSSEGQSGHALLFARFPIGQFQSGTRLAFEAALGGSHYQQNWRPMYRGTFSFGKDLDTTWGTGWLAVDLAYETHGATSGGIWKLDATLGLNRAGSPAPLLQIETSKLDGHPLFYSITPSVRLPLKGEKDLVIGLQKKRAPHHSLGIKLALWHWF